MASDIISNMKVEVETKFFVDINSALALLSAQHSISKHYICQSYLTAEQMDRKSASDETLAGLWQRSLDVLDQMHLEVGTIRVRETMQLIGNTYDKPSYELTIKSKPLTGALAGAVFEITHELLIDDPLSLLMEGVRIDKQRILLSEEDNKSVTLDVFMHDYEWAVVAGCILEVELIDAEKEPNDLELPHKFAAYATKIVDQKAFSNYNIAKVGVANFFSNANPHAEQ